MPNNVNVDEFDPFAGDSGFKDDFDGTIKEAWFAVRQGGGDNIFANFLVAADDGDDIENRYGCGSEWASFDGGSTIEHPKGGSKKFHNQTKYYGLFSAALECDGAREYLVEKTRNGPKNSDGLPLGPRAASLWVGTKWHWMVKTEHVSFPDKANPGQMIERDVSTVIPVAFLGADGASSGGSGSAASGSSSPTPAAETLPAELLAQLATVAKSAADFGRFVDAAMEIPGVPESGAAMGKVGDEAFYNSLLAG